MSGDFKVGRAIDLPIMQFTKLYIGHYKQTRSYILIISQSVGLGKTLIGDSRPTLSHTNVGGMTCNSFTKEQPQDSGS